jgi:hypothetical protein
MLTTDSNERYRDFSPTMIHVNTDAQQKKTHRESGFGHETGGISCNDATRQGLHCHRFR